uniref:Death inducer-obliterator 1 n=1 Tax=Xenopus tropicalis TaxID=8364 RepID=A0A803JDP8_XENTR
MEESGNQAGPSLRRSGRQPKRTERVEEFLTTVRRNRGRKSAPLEDSSDRSCPVTDAETASEGSVESTPDVKGDSQSSDPKYKNELTCKAEIKKEEDDSSDSDGMTLKELQNRLRSRRSDHTSTASVPTQALGTPKSEPGSTGECTVRTRSANRAALLQQQTPIKSPIKQEPESPPPSEEQKQEETSISPKRRSETEIYDPNALYCICRQRHNNRFMICCDRCEEWFHGDCVGIPEARGRLLERNGEDYICPNCTIQQSQAESATDSDQKEDPQYNSEMRIETAESSDDQGIKGRIEKKAAHSSGKKKLKIFHPVPQSTVVSEPPPLSGPSEASDSSEVARCIGPGCSNLALPDSVYCSHDCILKHAAAAMKSLNVAKDVKPKEKIKVKTEKRIQPKPQASAKPPTSPMEPVSERKESVAKRVPDMNVKVEAANEPRAEGSSTPSWESDHNYIAVKPEKTAAISSTLFYKCIWAGPLTSLRMSLYQGYRGPSLPPTCGATFWQTCR